MKAADANRDRRNDDHKSETGEAPGNALVTRRRAGLPYDSVVNVSQLANIDKMALSEPYGQLNSEQMRLVDRGLRLAISLPE